MAYALNPLPAPVGVYPQYTSDKTETLVLKEKIVSLPGDSFDVLLADGRPLLKVKAKVLSVGARRSVFDAASGTHLFDIYRDLMHVHTTYVLEDPSGNKFFELRNNIRFLSTSATAHFATKATGKPEALTMRGSWNNLRGDIKDDTGHVVARIDRQLLNARELVFHQSSYAVVVAPGMDMAIVAAMCICLDDKAKMQYN
ncbi:uncharacterized protein SPSK_07968 [Sporothrix schenckii 1099-18]|uniref:DUF567 domain protein n=1 Tax=Sporothrix schenckii 1099-18 TaxID=1397361 RepID=A0A0F2MEJ1_SPOSC|nr:uncharacterized protein SPSK_07968 [Sporothrix schenckii 1099-18]KJR88103.1 hypothetical protein SPSK_07968 [Sporothrix schenckii 1099-18]